MRPRARTIKLSAQSRPGNAAFVPPPPDEVLECMSKLELFLHDQPQTTPALVKAALSHVQFETIHPYLDGNGRLGRLLITLLLCEQQVLREPMLYLSLYFKSHQLQQLHRDHEPGHRASRGIRAPINKKSAICPDGRPPDDSAAGSRIDAHRHAGR
ncbi:Fic family protein [Paraburkholderia sp. WC7.3g]|uniref:Fic family protein n=1 Tax=Paraburkholderia sp. WC7.3g TaxID=2991070 RepID=UPI003D1CAB61